MKQNTGFSLLELLVVIGIIGMLVALGVANYSKAQQKTRDTIRKSELKQIQNALELYKNDQMPQAYPAALATLVTTYIKAVPKDPREEGLPGSWADYTYAQGAGLTYTLTACLENTSDPEVTITTCGQGSAGRIYQLTEP